MAPSVDRPGEMRALSAAIGRRSVAWKGWARSGREDEGSAQARGTQIFPLDSQRFLDITA